jgi:hypothetical protein
MKKYKRRKKEKLDTRINRRRRAFIMKIVIQFMENRT